MTLAAPPPTTTRVATPGAWDVRALRPGAPPMPLTVTAATTDKTYPTTRRVDLTLGASIPADAVRVEVTLLLDNQPSAATKPAPELPDRFEAVDDADDATLYSRRHRGPVGGRAHAVARIDGRADVTLARMGATEATRVSLVGVFKADERKHADPDSAKLELQVQRVAGSKNLHLVASPRRIRLPRHGLQRAYGRHPAPDGRHDVHDKGRGRRRCAPSSALNVQIGVGIEAGANVKNTIDAASPDGEKGSGGTLPGQSRSRDLVDEARAGPGPDRVIERLTRCGYRPRTRSSSRLAICRTTPTLCRRSLNVARTPWSPAPSSC